MIIRKFSSGSLCTKVMLFKTLYTAMSSWVSFMQKYVSILV